MLIDAASRDERIKTLTFVPIIFMRLQKEKESECIPIEVQRLRMRLTALKHSFEKGYGDVVNVNTISIAI